MFSDENPTIIIYSLISTAILLGVLFFAFIFIPYTIWSDYKQTNTCFTCNKQ